MPSAGRSPRRRTPPRGELFARIDALARNLWWTWNPEAQRVFAALDPVAWEATNHNPIQTLASLSPQRRAVLREDARFAALVAETEAALQTYLSTRTWFERVARSDQRKMLAAYFCSEFALHECMPQYAGGLGVLAGDHLKSASDLGIPLVGVGLLYRHGYYRQELRGDGTTRVVYPQHDFSMWPLRDTGKHVRVPVGTRSVMCKIWRMLVGRVSVYLLDSDIPANDAVGRGMTRPLYGGDQELRIQQEVLLGVGCLMALDVLRLRPTVCHLNEGHAAFCGLERVRRLVRGGASFERAAERVRQAAVFTTHTPVPEGHDRFPPKLFLKYLGHYARELGIDRKRLLSLGRENPADAAEPFCMTVLGLRLSERCNGVAALHGETTRRMWKGVYRLNDPTAVPIGSVTNGVHSQTWLAPEMAPLYERWLKPKWVGAGPEHDPWRHAERIPAAELWRMRGLLRRRTIHFVRQRLIEQVRRRGGSLSELADAAAALDEQALLLGFSRRFALYKRADLMFHDPRRLAAILNHPKRPAQVVFAGKAHPLDAAGQALARRVFEFSQRDEFRGRVVLLEEYDMQIGRMLTSGADVWLNNPLRPQEASGTSGMKPPLHGGINCSVLDGWWPECYDGDNGWTIGRPVPQPTRAKQDRFDADSLYRVLEREIVPEFYARDADGLPQRWIRRMRASMMSVGRRFSSHRMLAEYLEMYAPARSAARPPVS